MRAREGNSEGDVSAGKAKTVRYTIECQENWDLSVPPPSITIDKEVFELYEGHNGSTAVLYLSSNRALKLEPRRSPDSIDYEIKALNKIKAYFERLVGQSPCEDMFNRILFDGQLQCGDKSKTFFVMDRIPHGFRRVSIKDLIQKNTAAVIWEQVAAAMLVLSDCNMTHGDLLFDEVYQNLFFNPETQSIKIIDFDKSSEGIVKYESESEAQIALSFFYGTRDTPYIPLQDQINENIRIRQKYNLPENDVVEIYPR